MAFVVADRVKETSTSTGTGTITLAGAVTGFQSFAAVGNGNTTYYCIASQSANEWEVGLGTYTSAGTTLARTTVLSSSNAGSLVNFSAGTKDVFVTYPSGYSVYSDGTRATGTWGISISGNAATATSATSATTAGSVTNSVTFNNGGAGAVSGTTFNGSAAQTISYNTLGASPLAGSSSLTTTGTVTSGTWSASFGAVSGANLTNLTAGNLTGTISSAVLGNSTLYVGTTAVALNRASANLALTGISSVTFPGSVSGTTALQASATAGTTTITMPATTGTMALTSDIPTVNNGTLTLATSGTGLSGSASFTANQSGNSTFTVTSNATNANTASTIVARDASGNFSAGTITASLSGNATSATTATTATTATQTSNAVTFNNGGAGAASGTTFNGSAAQTISYNTIGAPSTTGTNASGTWSINVTGSAGSATTATTASNLTNFTAATSANGSNVDSPTTLDVVGYCVQAGLPFSQGDGGLYTAGYSTSWYHQIFGDFRSGQIAIRGKNNGVWQSWRTVLDSSNYNSYSPTLTGTGASGTWSINVTGSAGSATTATNIAGGAANQIHYQTGAGATSFITAPTVSSTYLQWNGSAFTWAAAGGGAAAGGAVYENTQTISSNYTMTTNYNGVSAGPITINTGVTVTIPTGSNWSIV